MSRDSQNMPLIETVYLKKYFGTGSGVLHAVDDMDLAASPQETLGIVRESGCGEFTLGKAILRLTPATEGRTLYSGKDILSCNPNQLKELQKEMQIISQDPCSSLNSRMTASELIVGPLVANRVMKSKAQFREGVAELMETVNLAPCLESACPHELDGGRRQRTGIARVLSVNPKLIVCDGPISALDVPIQTQIFNLLMDLQDNMGLTYISITHNLSMIYHIFDEITVTYLG